MDSDQYRPEHRMAGDSAGTGEDTAVRYHDAAVLGGIHTGGPTLGATLAAAGYGRAGAAITCGSVIATMAYAVMLDRYRDGTQEPADSAAGEPAEYVKVSPDSDTGVEDGTRRVLEVLDEFGVLEDELSSEQQEQYSEEIREIRADD